MKFANPTSVQIGMGATFVGIHYRVIGRVVMGVEDEGQMYYWNEFNLAGDNGQAATLVYEITEKGGEWRLFTLFEPETPISAQEAASKRVDDFINLDGTRMHVTLVDQSCVKFIEGIPPEGESLGSVAHYFNAEAPGKMLVVSWTGHEVEFYHGMNLPRHVVANAFGLLRDAPEKRLRLQSSDSNNRWIPALIIFLIVAFMGVEIFSSIPKTTTPAPPKKPKLLEAPKEIHLDRRSKFEGEIYRAGSHAIVEIAQVGQRFDRHEYNLIDDDGKTSLLIYGLKPGLKEWFLFTPFEPAKAMTPMQAANLRAGDSFEPDHNTVKITAIFQATILRKEGTEPVAWTNGTAFYNFSADDSTNHYLARWNQDGITFYRGKTCTEKKVLSAFR